MEATRLQATRKAVCPSVGGVLEDVELRVLGCLVDIIGTNCDQCVNMVQCCFTSTETVRLIRDGEPRTDTSTFTQILSSGGVLLRFPVCNCSKTTTTKIKIKIKKKI